MDSQADVFFQSVASGDKNAVRVALAGDPTLAVARDREAGSTPLHFAAHRGFLEIVQALLDHGADVSALEELSSTTPLHWAAEGGHPEVVRLLLARGAGLEVRDAWFGLTPLGWATAVSRVKMFQEDRPAAARLLREAGARTDAFVELGADDVGALRRVISGDPAELSRRLCFGGDEMQPLHWAGAYGREAAIPVLVEAGADPKARTSLGLTAMGAALQRAQSGAAAVLVTHGILADESSAVVGGFVPIVEATPTEVLTPALSSRLLFVAAGEGHAPMVKVLAARGADPTLRLHRLIGEVPMKATALHIAAREGHADAVKALLELGAPIGAGIDDGGLTPLHVAASEGRDLAVSALLERGADRKIRDRRYDGTPADWAAAFGYHALAALLRAQA